VAIAALARPAILFAEPTGNLDAATGAAVADLLFQRARKPGRRSWSRTTRRWPPAAAAWCGSPMAKSSDSTR
jgi:hypothetical protein